jgi:sugar phosphate isomerase/epimerase
MTHPLKIGCQTYTWEMLGDRWTGTPDDLVGAIADAGYAGIEITDTMIGGYAGRPQDFARRLGDAGLALVAFSFASDSGFTEPDRIAGDLDLAERWLDFAAHFPGVVLALGSATVVSGGDRDGKFAVAAQVYNRTAEIARDRGVDAAVHPSSHHDTLLLGREDYDRIFAQLDAGVGWVPDTGHILRGGMTLGDALAAFGERILYAHLKDVDRQGDWAMLGEGVVDAPAVIEVLRRAPRFTGWVIVEEESTTAAADPAAAVRANRETLRRLGL